MLESWPGRNDDPFDTELSSHLGCMHRSVAPESDQRAAARVAAALGRHRAGDTDHVRNGDQVDAVRGFEQVESKGLGDALSELTARRVGVDAEAATKQMPRIEISENHVGISQRGLLVAKAITHRARHSTRALGANAQAAAGVDTHQAATAGANLGNIQRWHAQQVATAFEHATTSGDARANLVFCQLK